jgi:hypothetical protein
VSLLALLVFASYYVQKGQLARLPGKAETAVAIEYVEIEIELSQGVGTSFDLALVKDSSPHSHSFGSNLHDGKDYLFSVAYEYSSYVRLSHPFDGTELSEGHLIVFWLIRSDPNTMKAKSSKLFYGLFKGGETLIADDEDVKITLRPSSGRNKMR